MVLFILMILLPFIFSLGSLRSPRPAASSGLGVYRSVDNGEHWTLQTTVETSGVPFPSQILAMEISPSDPNIIYLGSRGAGLWISENGGDSWVRASDPQNVLKPNAEIYSIALSRARPQQLYLAVFQDNLGKVLKSLDGGRSFLEVYSVTQDRFGVFGVAVDQANPDRIYIATGQGGFFESNDQGKTWRIQKWFPDGLTRLLADPADSSEYYVVSSHGEMFRTNNRGLSWLRLTEGYSSFSKADKIADLTFDPLNYSTIYSASSYGLLRSADRGVHWEQVRLIVPTGKEGVSAAAINPNDSSFLYAGVGQDLYASRDGGTSWRTLSLRAPAPIRLLRVNPRDPKVIFAVISN